MTKDVDVNLTKEEILRRNPKVRYIDCSYDELTDRVLVRVLYQTGKMTVPLVSYPCPVNSLDRQLITWCKKYNIPIGRVFGVTIENSIFNFPRNNAESKSNPAPIRSLEEITQSTRRVEVEEEPRDSEEDKRKGKRKQIRE